MIPKHCFRLPAWLFPVVVAIVPALSLGEVARVDCDAGNTIQGALETLTAGDTLLVSGVCVESVEITQRLDGLILDGQGTATIRGPDASQDTLRLVGLREVTVRGFRITGGRDGIQTRWVTAAFLFKNTVEQTGRNGIQATRNSYVHMADNTIQNNPRNGIEVQDSRVRIGSSLDEPPQPSPNIIQGNGGHGIALSRGSVARILGNTIRNNRQNGISVEKLSQADIASNVIEGNMLHGIQATQNSGVNLGTETGGGLEQAPNSAGAANGQYGIECSLGAYAHGRLGSLSGASGSKRFITGANDGLLP